MTRTDCFNVGRQDIEIAGTTTRFYSLSIQDDKRCVNPVCEDHSQGLYIEIEHATKDDLLYVYRHMKRLITDCLGEEVIDE